MAHGRNRLVAGDFCTQRAWWWLRDRITACFRELLDLGEYGPCQLLLTGLLGQTQRLFQVPQRLGTPASLGKAAAEIVFGYGLAGPEPRGPLARFDGFADAAGFQQCLAEIVVSSGVIGSDSTISVKCSIAAEKRFALRSRSA